MDLGRDLGNFVGKQFPETVLEARPSQATLLETQIEWIKDPFYENALFHIFTERERIQITSEVIVNVPVFQRRSFVEIIGSGPENQDEDFIDPVNRLEAPGGNRIFLTWEFPEDQEDELNKFQILFDDGGGTPNIVIGSADPEDRVFVTDFIINGSYIFRINPIDINGNILQATSTDTVVVVSSTPVPVEGLAFTYDSGTEKATFTWNVVADTGADVKVYTNGGSGPIDWVTEIATVTFPTATFTTGVLVSGDHKFGFRTILATVLDPSVDRFVGFKLRGAAPPLIALFPNESISGDASPVFGANVTISFAYSAFGQEETAVSAKIYSNIPGGATPMDFVTPIATVTIPSSSVPEEEVFQRALEFTTGALTIGAEHKFVIRIQGVTNETENTTPELLATPVAEPQPQPTSVTAEVI